MKIYVIIVTYNGMKWIDWCLQSLRQSTSPLIPVVIDNGSTDGLREYVPTHFPEVIWMPQDQNLGFGQGNNIGMEYALRHGADYVLLLNQDAALHPDAVERMLEVADGHNVVTPIHLCGDGTRIDYMFRNSLKRADNELFDDLILESKPKLFYEVGEVCAACWLLPIKLLKEIGGFNPLFFQYGEDNNYYTRLVYHNRKMILAVRARMCHDRKIHGNAKLFNRKRLRILNLVTVCNPGLSIAGRVSKLLLLWMKNPVHEVGELFLLLRLFPKISDSVKKEREVGPNWLKI